MTCVLLGTFVQAKLQSGNQMTPTICLQEVCNAAYAGSVFR